MPCNRTTCICTSSVPRAVQRPSPASSPSSSARRTPAPTSPYTPRRKPSPPTTVCCCSSRSTAGACPSRALRACAPCAERTPRSRSWPCSATAPWTMRCWRCATRSPRWAFAWSRRRRSSRRTRSTPTSPPGVRTHPTAPGSRRSVRSWHKSSPRTRLPGSPCPETSPTVTTTVCRSSRPAVCAASAAACARTTAPPERSRRTRRKRSTSTSASPVCAASRSARRRRAACRCRCGWLPPRR